MYGMCIYFTQATTPMCPHWLMSRRTLWSTSTFSADPWSSTMIMTSYGRRPTWTVWYVRLSLCPHHLLSGIKPTYRPNENVRLLVDVWRAAETFTVSLCRCMKANKRNAFISVPLSMVLKQLLLLIIITSLRAVMQHHTRVGCYLF